MRRPFMPLYWGDYLADTQHLETVQHGAYLLLIAHYWMNENLPDSDSELARITKLPVKSWRHMRPSIQIFFHDGWKHKRIDEEMARYGEKVARLKVAGSNGGTKAKMARDKAKELAGNPVAYASSQASSNHNQTTISSSSFPTAARATAATSKKKRLSNGEAGAGSSAELDGIMTAKGWRP